MRLKKIFLFTMISVLLTTSPVSVLAAEQSESLIAPCDLYTDRVSAHLTISSTGTANILVNVIGRAPLTTKIFVYVYLQQYKNGVWQSITTWSQTKTATSNSLTKNVAVEKGYQYRVKVSSYVYSGEKYEDLVTYSAVVSYK